MIDHRTSFPKVVKDLAAQSWKHNRIRPLLKQIPLHQLHFYPSIVEKIDHKVPEVLLLEVELFEGSSGPERLAFLVGLGNSAGFGVGFLGLGF